MSSLNRKLLRDLWHLRGQMLAIVLVVVCGVATVVTSRVGYESLELSRATYYAQYRFGDVFAALKRAPERVAQKIAAIPGVSEVRTRVVFQVTLDVPGLDEPAQGRVVSIPERQAPILNGVHIAKGRYIAPERRNEVLVSEAFATANRLAVGDRIGAVLNGRWAQLVIVGFALSPEFVYAIPSGGVLPDDRRFGVLWMSRQAMGPAFDMDGAFNDVVVQLDAAASEAEVLVRLDRILQPYGGLRAYGRADHISDRFLSDEIRQNREFGIVLPLLFLAVAAFLLNVLLSRLIAMQRDQIGVLKAFGYSSRAVAVHYMAFALVGVLAGGVIGTGVGLWLGSLVNRAYVQLYHFPLLRYEVNAKVILFAIGVTLIAALVGGLGAMRRAWRVPPAEAMRPEFRVVQRDDVTLVSHEPLPASARHALARLPGVVRAEAFRLVPVQLRAGHTTRKTAITGLDDDVQLRRLINSDLEDVALPPEGVLLTTKLAEILGVGPGDPLTVEVLEGARPTHEVQVSGTVDELIGLSAYMNRDALARLLREGGTVSGAMLQIDAGREVELYRTLKQLPAIGGVSIRKSMIDSFAETLGQSMAVFTSIIVAFASILSFAVVYNAARIALSERGRELASLRVLGFTRAEIGAMLLGEQALLTTLAIPIGYGFGYWICALLSRNYQWELFRLPLVISSDTYVFALVTVLAAAIASALIVRRRLARLDLVAVLKTRE